MPRKLVLNRLQGFLRFCFAFYGLLACGEGTLFAASDQANTFLSPVKTHWPPLGTKKSYPVTRDTWISAVPDEAHGSNGGAKELKIKSLQEFVILDMDLSDLKGKIVTGALLHLRSASPEKAPLARLSVGSVASPWSEGTSTRYRPQTGSSSFMEAFHQQQDWSYPGSTFMDVTLGLGHTIWKFAECHAPDPQGWQSCAVAPEVIAARVAGLSHGFALYDDVGSTWSMTQKQFEYTLFPNRFFYSREARHGKPWLTIWTEGTDTVPPQAIKAIEIETLDFPSGEVLVSWKTPADVGGGKTLGFEVSYLRGNHKNSMPRYLIPMAGKTGEPVRMHIQDLDLKAGEEIDLSIRPVDSAGNIGPAFIRRIRVSSGVAPLHLPPPDAWPFPAKKEGVSVGGVKVSIVDLLDKIDPVRGTMIPAREEGYKNGNHLFSAKELRVRLQSARNETVFFQVNLEGTAKNIRVAYAFEGHEGLKTNIYEFAYVDVMDSDGKKTTTLPDPLLPLTTSVSIPSKAGPIRIPGQTNHSLILEIYVPHEESPGKKRGQLSLSTGSERLEIGVDLNVWNFTLPNKLSFIPEMNAYKTVSPYVGYDDYRLAHAHRTVINRLPYGWHGVPEFAPEQRGGHFDWAEWDQKVGPLLDGSAFKGLPRSGEPVDVFYLPFNENWPVNIFEHYQPSYWADEAFRDQYKTQIMDSFSDFAQHFNSMGWHDTLFQFYLNNKVYYREKFFRSSAPWILDEPVHTQDFWALRWYGLLWHTAVDPVKGNAQMWYRGDISHGPFSRNILWGLMDMTYIGQNTIQKMRQKRDEVFLSGKSYFAEYGTANKIEMPNTQPVLWSLSAWAKGASAILPWNSIGSEAAWRTAEQTALFYPDAFGPKASVRLKAFTTGQQMVEYLTLLSEETKKPRYAVSEWLKQRIVLEEDLHQSYEGDAGTTTFQENDTVKLWALRYQVGKAVSELGPAYKRALVKWRAPEWDIARLPDLGYVSVAPQVSGDKPRVDHFSPE